MIFGIESVGMQESVPVSFGMRRMCHYRLVPGAVDVAAAAARWVILELLTSCFSFFYFSFVGSRPSAYPIEQLIKVLLYTDV